MITFALDSSGKTAGVCVLDGDRVVTEYFLDRGLTHSETLLPLADRAFSETGLTPKEVDLFAVTCGPGSFTGLRIGLALVKGLALPYNTPTAGVSTLEALALGSSLAGTVVPALDARRKEVYWGMFDCSPSGCRRSQADTAGSVSDIGPLLAEHGNPVYFLGDGAYLCYELYGDLPQVVLADDAASRHIALGAAMAGRQAALRGKVTGAEALTPSYLRLSQAERERRARENRL